MRLKRWKMYREWCFFFCLCGEKSHFHRPAKRFYRLNRDFVIGNAMLLLVSYKFNISVVFSLLSFFAHRLHLIVNLPHDERQYEMHETHRKKMRNVFILPSYAISIDVRGEHRQQKNNNKLTSNDKIAFERTEFIYLMYARSFKSVTRSTNNLWMKHFRF